ncbi:MAG: hypothetical protein KC594_19020, partial [Nitrospira sp.]|nr:hypothetical protein [Nitrospira sp.]
PPGAASRQSLPACASSGAFQRPLLGSIAYFTEDHFSGGRPPTLDFDPEPSANLMTEESAPW